MDTRQEKKKKIGPRSPIDVRLIIIGLLFFVNPCVSVIDVLPDFIGAILVLCGFLHFASIDDRAHSAQRALVIFSFVDAGKVLLSFFVRSVTNTTWDLVFTFVFGVAEAALFAYALIKLHAAVTYRASRLDCEEMLVGFSSFVGLTVLFAVLKNLLAILPELTELTSEYGTVSLGAAGEKEISHFVHTALTILNLLVVTAYGIGWWIYMRRYFKKLGGCGGFLASLEEQYVQEVGSRPEVLTYRALKTSGILLFAALIFLLPLRLDGTDFLPDFAAGVLMMLAALRLTSLYPRAVKIALIPGAAYTLMAAAEWAGELILRQTLTLNYDVGYYASMQLVLLRHPEKMSIYVTIIALGIVKFLLLAVFLFFLARIFRPIIAEHTGVAYDVPSAYAEKKDASVKRGLRRLLTAVVVCSVALAASGILRRVMRMFSDLTAIEYVELIAALPLLILYAVFLAKLETAIDNKYYIDR